MPASPHDTIAAIATPIGEGSVGMIRVSGSRAFALAQQVIRPSPQLDPAPPRFPHCVVGRFVHHEHTLDHVVATFFKGPQSYTGEDVMEIAGHGNPALLATLLQALLSQGARAAEPGEFTLRAFQNGKIDLTQAEAVADLIRAKTDRAQHAAREQLFGRLGVEIRRWRDHLLPLLAHVEVALDHSDDDHEFLAREGLIEQCERLQEGLTQLLRSGPIGQRLRDGLRVVLVGKPNVGKSSLLNALLKHDRAIVTAIPGTTRDTLEEWTDWNGLPVLLTDTAGVRATASDPVEHLGIERSRRAMAAADFIFVVQDASQSPDAEDEAVLAAVAEKPHVLVLNKSDLGQRSVREGLAVSALTGEGLERLTERVSRFALGETAGSLEARWMLNQRHRETLERATEALARATAAARADAYEDVIALELRTALSALGEIIGETTTEDLLGQIFANFCIGK